MSHYSEPPGFQNSEETSPRQQLPVWELTTGSWELWVFWHRDSDLYFFIIQLISFQFMNKKQVSLDISTCLNLWREMSGILLLKLECTIMKRICFTHCALYIAHSTNAPDSSMTCLFPLYAACWLKIVKISPFVHSHGENPVWSLSRDACQTLKCVCPPTTSSCCRLAHGNERYHSAFHVLLEIPPGAPGTHVSVCLRVPWPVCAHVCGVPEGWDTEFQGGARIPSSSAPWLANPAPAKAPEDRWSPADRVLHSSSVAQGLAGHSVSRGFLISWNLNKSILPLDKVFFPSLNK